MGAPSHTALGTPAGTPFKDGKGTLIVFSQDNDIGFWEVDLTPFAIDGGEMISLTTKRNSTVHTGAARQLIKLGDLKGSAAYSGAAYEAVMDLINQEGSITTYLEGVGRVSFYGYLKSFEPGNHKEGEQPKGSFVISITNRDSDGNEQPPVWDLD